MKSMWEPSAAIFFMTYFHRAGEGGAAWPHRLSMDPLLHGVLFIWIHLFAKFMTHNFLMLEKLYLCLVLFNTDKENFS